MTDHTEDHMTNAELVAEVRRLREALAEIAEGRGRFSLDHHEHAMNTIRDMKERATAALDNREPVI